MLGEHPEPVAGWVPGFNMNIWSRLGLSVAFCAGYYILMVELLQKTAQFQAYKMQCILGLLGGGALMALLSLGSRSGRSGNVNASGELGGGTAGPGDAGASNAGGRGLFTLSYCGCMLMAFGLITLMITPTARSQAMALARAVTGRPRPARPQAQPATAQSPIPGLKLQGIIYRPNNPSAVINGQPVFQGETVAGALVKTITTDAVILAWGGNEVVLSLSGRLGQASQPP
jgi:hypothetical protein